MSIADGNELVAALESEIDRLTAELEQAKVLVRNSSKTSGEFYLETERLSLLAENYRAKLAEVLDLLPRDSGQGPDHVYWYWTPAHLRTFTEIRAALDGSEK